MKNSDNKLTAFQKSERHVKCNRRFSILRIDKEHWTQITFHSGHWAEGRGGGGGLVRGSLSRNFVGPVFMEILDPPLMILLVS